MPVQIPFPLYEVNHSKAAQPRYSGRMKRLIAFITYTGLVLTLYGCPVVRATGQSVEAVGQGAGHAVAGTGRAIERSAD